MLHIFIFNLCLIQNLFFFQVFIIVICCYVIFFVVNFMILGMYIFIIIIILHILSCFIGLRWRWEINKIKVTKYSWVLVSLGFLQLNIRHFFVKNFPAVSSSKGNKYFTLPQSCFNLTLPKGPCELLPSLVVSPYPKGHVSYCHHLFFHPTQRAMWTIVITCLTLPKGPCELLPSLVVSPYQVIVVIIKLQ